MPTHTDLPTPDELESAIGTVFVRSHNASLEWFESLAVLCVFEINIAKMALSGKEQKRDDETREERRARKAVRCFICFICFLQRVADAVPGCPGKSKAGGGRCARWVSIASAERGGASTDGAENATRAHARPQRNDLIKQTPFLCDYEFRCELPLPPCEPRLLPIELDIDAMTAFRPEAVIGAYLDAPLTMPWDPDLYISLDPLECERFRIPPGDPPPLDAELEALLAPEATPVATGFRHSKSAKGAKTGWLMRTLYLADTQLPKGSADENAHARVKKAKELAEAGVLQPLAPGADARAHQIASISASFDAVRAPPVHATRPGLTAVAVCPLLPDFSRWHGTLCHAHFDADPLGEVGYMAAADDRLRAAAASSSAAKGYSLRRDDGSTERFIAFLPPTHATAQAVAAAGAAETAPPVERQLLWGREFSYAVVEEEEEAKDGGAHNRLLALFWDGEGPACWAPVGARLQCARRVRRREGDADVERPRSITLVDRPQTEEEARAAEEGLRALRPAAAGALEEPQNEMDALFGGDSD